MIRRNSVHVVKITGTLGAGSSSYNLMLLFFEKVLIGSDDQKVEFFKQLTDSNETLLNLVIDKKADIEEYNQIIDFLKDLSDDEV